MVPACTGKDAALKVLVFCDGVYRWPEFRESLAGHQVHFLTCSPRGWAPRFVVVQLVKAFRRFRPRDWFVVLKALVTGHSKIVMGPLGSPSSLAFLDQVCPDIALHAMGVIYRKAVIERCGAGILNAHIGRLPTYRGRSVMEWSILCGDPTGVTVFFIDEGIDTGARIVLFQESPIRQKTIAAAKAELFALDIALFRRALDVIERGEPPAHNDTAEGRRFYEMSLLFQEVVGAHLARSHQNHAIDS